MKQTILLTCLACILIVLVSCNQSYKLNNTPINTQIQLYKIYKAKGELNMNLYQIENEIQQCLDNISIDLDTGEVLGIEQLEQLYQDKHAKIENIALYIKNLRAEEKAIKEEEKVLKERRTVIANKIKRLTKFLIPFLDNKQFKTAKVHIIPRDVNNLEIINEKELIHFCLNNKWTDAVTKSETLRINKTQLKKYIDENNNLKVPYINISNTSISIK